jgi:hypothetical protein
MTYSGDESTADAGAVAITVSAGATAAPGG